MESSVVVPGDWDGTKYYKVLHEAQEAHLSLQQDVGDIKPHYQSSGARANARAHGPAPATHVAFGGVVAGSSFATGGGRSKDKTNAGATTGSGRIPIKRWSGAVQWDPSESAVSGTWETLRGSGEPMATSGSNGASRSRSPRREGSKQGKGGRDFVAENRALAGFMKPTAAAQLRARSGVFDGPSHAYAADAGAGTATKGTVMKISGASDDAINGLYSATGDIYNGHPLFRKQGVSGRGQHHGLWLRVARKDSHTELWMVSLTEHKDANEMQEHRQV